MEPARGPGGNTNATRGSDLVGMGWKDLVIRKSPLEKFFIYFQITTLGGVHVSDVSVSPGVFLDDDLKKS